MGSLERLVRIAKSFKRNGGEQQHRRAADFFEPVNVVHVFARIVADPFLRLGDQFVAFAELGGARGTDFRARGLLSLGHAVGTHGALLHFGNELAPFIFRNAEGTRHHAVAASHALRRVVSDRTERRLLHRAHRTDRRARGIVAVHAQAAHELVAAREHDRHLVCGLDFFGGDGVVVGKLVLGGAGLFALLAADADRGII